MFFFSFKTSFGYIYIYKNRIFKNEIKDQNVIQNKIKQLSKEIVCLK